MLATGQLSATDLAEEYLGRITELNSRLNAVLATDRAGALSAAAASDERRRAGATLGPLDGIPVLIKDNIEAVGLPATAGSRALLESPVHRDAPLVGALRDAGLVLLGSTNLSEWANFRSTASTSGWSAVGGQTRNPHDTGRNTSGSSSGSAASVAAGLAPLAVGTETDGSIVSPAGVCGVVGFKPTLGTVPGQGIVPISSRQDTAGPMARRVADAAALYSVLCGRPLALQPLALPGVRVAMWLPEQTPADVAAVLDDVTELLERAGCQLVAAHGVVLNPFEDSEFTALVAEFAAELPAYLGRRSGGHPRTWPELLAFNRADDIELSRFGDEIFELAAKAPSRNTLEYRRARADTDSQAGRSFVDVLSGCDFAVAPTNSPAWPVQYGQTEDFDVLTSSLCAVTGAPSVSLPAAVVNGLPVGVSVLGRHGQDEQVLGFAAALEALLPPTPEPPATP